MKKTFYPPVLLLVFTLMSQAVLSIPITNNDLVQSRKKSGSKEKRMSIVSSRASGQVQVRFMAEKAGEATITVVNEQGKIILQQKNQISDGVNTISIDNLLTLHEGFYTVNLASQKDSYSSRLLFWK